MYLFSWHLCSKSEFKFIELTCRKIDIVKVTFNIQGTKSQYTDSTKINRPGNNIRMHWTNFKQPTAHLQQDIFGKTLIQVCSLHLYASFGTFWVQIGQLFAPQWVFEHSEEVEIGDILMFKHFSKAHCDTKNWPIWTQKVPKEA